MNISIASLNTALHLGHRLGSWYSTSVMSPSLTRCFHFLMTLLWWSGLKVRFCRVTRTAFLMGMKFWCCLVSMCSAMSMDMGNFGRFVSDLLHPPLLSTKCVNIKTKKIINTSLCTCMLLFTIQTEVIICNIIIIQLLRLHLCCCY